MSTTPTATTRPLPAAHVNAGMAAVLAHADDHGLPLTSLTLRDTTRSGHPAVGVTIDHTNAASWLDSLGSESDDEPEYRLRPTGFTVAELDGVLPIGVRVHLTWGIWQPVRECKSCGIETDRRSDACENSDLCAGCRSECRCFDCRDYAAMVESDRRADLHANLHADLLLAGA